MHGVFHRIPQDVLHVHSRRQSRAHTAVLPRAHAWGLGRHTELLLLLGRAAPSISTRSARLP